MEDCGAYGITFDYQHIVTGKGIDDHQSDALLAAMVTNDRSSDVDPPEATDRVAMSIERVIRD